MRVNLWDEELFFLRFRSFASQDLNPVIDNIFEVLQHPDGLNLVYLMHNHYSVMQSRHAIR